MQIRISILLTRPREMLCNNTKYLIYLVLVIRGKKNRLKPWHWGGMICSQMAHPKKKPDVQNHCQNKIIARSNRSQSPSHLTRMRNHWSWHQCWHVIRNLRQQPFHPRPILESLVGSSIHLDRYWAAHRPPMVWQKFQWHTKHFPLSWWCAARSGW